LPGTNEAALRAAVEAFNDPRRREDYLKLYAPDVVLHGYPAGLSGLEGARSFYSQLWEAFPDAHLTIEAAISDGDELAARYRLSGVQAQDFYGAPATPGGTIEVEGVAWLRFEYARAVEVWQSSGTLATVTRLTAHAARAPTRTSASAEAAALRWEEEHADE
jgi:predicted ester cyclase